MTSIRKALAVAAIAAGSVVLAAPAQAYTLQNIGGGDGYVVPVGTGFDLFGADNSCGGCSTTLSDVAATDMTLTFNYTYTTNDLTGDSFFDPAGYFIGDVFTQLTVGGLGTDPVQSGTVTATIAAGQTFGFFVNSTGFLGRADLLVTPQDTGGGTGAVPEPASWAMMITGFGLVGGAMRSRRATRAFA